MSQIRRQVHQPRIGEIVARVLRQRILDGTLPDGAALPRQEDLMQEFGVSRPSLREALRELETEGLISIRRGNVGGAVVQLPSATTIAYMLSLALQTERAGIYDVSEALRHLEPLCVSLCAERSDRETTVVPALEAVHEELLGALDGGEQEFTAAANRFHEALVRNCGNHSLIQVVGALETIWSAHAERLASERSVTSISAKERRDGAATHAKIIKLIAAGDSKGASEIARRHLEYGQRVPLAGNHGLPVNAGLIREPLGLPMLNQSNGRRPSPH